MRAPESRISIPSLAVTHYQDVSLWKGHIDNATAVGGWAVFCVHRVLEDGTESTAHHIYRSQAEEIFEYTVEQNVWIANQTEATKYYCEWSGASVDADYIDGNILVTLTDEEDNTVYDEALTVKVTVPSSWTEASVGGSALTVNVDENGNSFVYIDIVPDSGVVSINGK